MNDFKEESKPKLTPLEIEFFKNLDPRLKWVARDIEDDEVWVYESKPEKGKYEWVAENEFECITILETVLKTKPFTWLNWEDEEPFYIPDLIKEG